MRTVNTFNKEYLYKCWTDHQEIQEQPSTGKTLGNIAFYGALIIVVTFAFFYNGNDNAGKRFGPFAYNTVLTGSMTGVYDQGSLVVSWALKPGEPVQAGLADGTDLVFITEEERVIVHRVIEVIDSYEDTSLRGFRTQGVANANPDDWVNLEPNVIGRVIWSVPYLGNILAFISENILLVVGMVVLLSIVISLWKIVFSKEEPRAG